MLDFDGRSLSRKEAAAYIGFSIPELDRKVKDREIEHFRIGRRVLFSVDALVAFRDRYKQPAIEEPK